MISLNKITLENRREVFQLSVEEEQKNYVASNLSSIASCYVLSQNGSQPIPLAIYTKDEMIGFVMIVYGETGYDQPKYATNSYCILRFMIDKKYQNQGYGKKAFSEIIKFIKAYPCEQADKCWISYKASNLVAKNLYKSYGFIETGEEYNGESIAILKI